MPVRAVVSGQLDRLDDLLLTLLGRWDPRPSSSYHDTSSATLEALRAFGKPGDDRVLPREGGTLWHWIHRAGELSGISRAHPHLLRSTFASVTLAVAGHVGQRQSG